MKKLKRAWAKKTFNNLIATNVMQIAEGGEYEEQNLIKSQMLNRSTTVDISTTPPLLAMCCYTLFFFIN